MSRDYRLFLSDISECCHKIERYTKGMDQEEFIANDMAFDAVMRNLEIIGEAMRHIPEEVRLRHSEVPWRTIVAFRNIVIHEYFGIDEDIVWDVIENKIPELLKQIEGVIAAE